MANLIVKVQFDKNIFKNYTNYSREMAASIITTWSLKMIAKMREKRDQAIQNDCLSPMSRISRVTIPREAKPVDG